MGFFGAIGKGLASIFGAGTGAQSRTPGPEQAAPTPPEASPPPERQSGKGAFGSSMLGNTAAAWGDDVSGFLHGQQRGVQSSNVSGALYNPDEHYLQLGYKNGGWYGYHDVSAQEATSFYSASSKGKWVWDHLRVRGTVFGYQKPYAFIGSKSQGYVPKYYGNDKHREEHRRIEPHGELPATWKAGGKGPYDERWAKASAPHPHDEQYPMTGASPHPKAEKHPMGKLSADETAAITHRKVPMAYQAPEEPTEPPVAKPAAPPLPQTPTPSTVKPQVSGSLSRPDKTSGDEAAAKHAPPETIPVAKSAPPLPPFGKPAHEPLARPARKEDLPTPSTAKPAAKVGFLGRLGAAIGSIFGGQRKAAGGEVQQRLGDGGDNEPIMATPGEYVETREERERIDRVTGRDSSKPGGSDGHFAKGGLVSTLGNYVGGLAKAAPKALGASIGGSLGFGGGLFGAVAGGMLGANVTGGGAGTSPLGNSVDPSTALIEAATELKAAAAALSGSGPPKNLPANGGMGPPNPFVNPVSGQPFLKGMSPLTGSTAAPPAAAGGGLEAAAGPAGIAIAAAMAVNNGLDQLAGGLGRANEGVVNFATGFATTLGVPKSLAELGGSILGVVSPLKGLELGVKAAQFALMPILNLDKPGEIVKDVFKGIADVGSKVVTALLDMRDPAAMFSQAVGPFLGQVGKYNPASIERFQLSLDNLSASAGRIFEPIIPIATAFADELNVLYTSVQGELRPIIGDVAGLMRDTLREPIVMLVGVVRDGAPIVRGLITDLAPMGPMVRTVTGFLGDLAGGGLQVVGRLFGALGPILGSAVEKLQPFVAIGSEMVRTFFTLSGAAWDVASVLFQIGRTILEPFIPIRPVLGLVIGSLQSFAATVSAIASTLARVVNDLKEAMSVNPVTKARAMWRLGTGAAFNEFGSDFNAAMRRMQQAGQPMQPLSGATTVAAQPARHVGIEEVGLEARRAVFSQGADLAAQTATNTANTAAGIQQILQWLRTMGFNVAPGPLPPGAMEG